MTDTPAPQHCGFAALIGAPNAGKSTLLNRLLGQKISIVSPKAQTTRMRVLGLLTEGETQMALIDTPGIFAGTTGSSKRLEKVMKDSVSQSLEDADAIVFLVDAASRPEKAMAVAETLKQREKKAFLALNKIDQIKREKLLPWAEQLNETGVFEETFMISALTGDGVKEMKQAMMARMPQAPWLYPDDELTDLPMRLLAAEATREQLFRQLHDEVPYEATVLPESWENKKDGSVVIHQTILVAREGHRAIVLGHGGTQIKSIGQAAREEISRLIDRKAHLFLDVKVDPTWQEKGAYYRLFGLEE